MLQTCVFGSRHQNILSNILISMGGKHRKHSSSHTRTNITLSYIPLARVGNIHITSYFYACIAHLSLHLYIHILSLIRMLQWNSVEALSQQGSQFHRTCKRIRIECPINEVTQWGNRTSDYKYEVNAGRNWMHLLPNKAACSAYWQISVILTTPYSGVFLPPCYSFPLWLGVSMYPSNKWPIMRMPPETKTVLTRKCKNLGQKFIKIA